MRKLSRFDWTAFGGVVALLTLIVTVLAWRLPQSPPEADGGTAPPSIAPTDPATPPPTDPPPAPTAEPSASRAPTIRNAGSVTMVDRGPGADLDSRAPDWGQADVSADVDLRITRLSDPPLAATSVVVLPGGSAPDYERCAAATGYDDQIMDAEIDVRASFCIRTSEGRLAHVTITDVSQRSDQVVDTITFEATTWEA